MNAQQDQNEFDRGFIRSQDKLKELFKANPKGKFILQILFSAKIVDNLLVGIENIPEGNAEYSSEKTTAYLYQHLDLREFLPKNIISLLEKEEETNKTIKIEFLVEKIGQELADTMHRDVKIIHQYVSWRPEEAAFDTYEFKPSK